MKLLVLLLTAATCIAATDTEPAVQLPLDLVWKTANRGSVSVVAKDLAAGRIDTHNFKTDYGSYDKDQTRIRRVGVTLRNFGRMPTSAALEILWFVTPERPPKGAVAQVSAFLNERKLLAEQELKR
jgi:hypothetical protein